MNEEPEAEVASEARDYLDGILERLGVDARVARYRIEDSILLHIDAEEAGRLIGRGGQTLEALQFLLNRIMRNQWENPPRIVIDVAGYRERHREQLVRQAREAADQVRRWGDPVILEPMNSFDRRVVHMALREDDDVETISPAETDENNRKRITIRIRDRAT